jgi:hypothetical protein
MSGIFFTTVLAVAALAFPGLLGASDITHVGVPVNDLITLQVTSGARNGCGPAKFEVVRVSPDGTTSAEAFRVPDGRSMVITELDWYYFNGAPGLTVVLTVFAENLRDANKRSIVFQSPLRLGSDGVGGVTERMTTGFAVSSGARLCFDVLNGTLGYPMRLSKVVLRGYLVDQR